MVVVHDASGILGRSGIERYAREVIRSMADVAPDVHLRLLGRRRRKPELERALGVSPLREIYEDMPHELMLGRQMVPATRLIQQRVWSRHVHDADLVHFVEGGRWKPRVPRYVVTVHDLFPLDPLYGAPPSLQASFPHMVDAMVHGASGVLTPSEYVAGTLRERYPELGNRLHVTPLAAAHVFRPQPIQDETLALAGLAHGQKYLLFIGRVDPRKNIERQLQAYISLPERLRAEVPFLLVLSGTPDMLEAFRTDSAKELGATGVVPIFNVSSAMLVELLANARGMVFATLAEGFGLPVLEAMQCGCAVLTSTLGSLPEVAGNCAIYADPFDEVQIADGMQRMIDDDATIEDLRQRGLERARMFTWTRTAEQTVAAYRMALER